MTLAGCMSLTKLRDLNPQANDFSSSLAAEYLAYANSESEQGHMIVAEHYARKGIKAANHENVAPDRLDTSLPQAERDQVASARGVLLHLLTSDMKSVAPQKLARAQLLFDCWQHQLSKHVSEDVAENIAPCADEFQSDVSELQTVADSFIHGSGTTHILQFAPGSAAIDADGRKVIDEVAAQLAENADYTVVVESFGGHKQHALARSRMNAVKAALVKVGVAANHIKIKQSSSKAVVLSSDGSEQHRDRVDITIQPYGQVRPANSKEEHL